MTNSNEGVSWDKLKETTVERLDLVINYLDFIYCVNHHLDVKDIVLRLRKLKRKITLADKPLSSLSYDESIHLQDGVIPIMIEWQPDLVRQMSDFYNSLVLFARITNDPQIAMKPSYFAKGIIDNWDKLFTFSEFLEDSIIKLNDERTSKKNEDEVFNLIKSLNNNIIKYFLEPFKINLKNVGIQGEFDPYHIFSITRKFDDGGVSATDYQYIVNSIEASNFDFLDNSNNPTYTFYGKIKNSENPLVFTYHDLLEFIAHAKFQFLSLLCIVAFMSIMATIRKYFIKNRPCHICQNGFLQVGYDKEMEKSRSNEIFAHIFWKCDNCNQIIRNS